MSAAVRAQLPRFRVVLGVLLAAAASVYAYLAPAVEEQLTPPLDDTVLPSVDYTDAGESLRDRLDTARVRYGRQTCETWTGNRWVCRGLAAWLWVGRHHGQATTDRGVERRACIWAHPNGKGKSSEPLSIVFPDVALGTDLHGEVALLDAARTGGPVDFSIRLGGKQRARVRVTDERGRRWKRWTVPTDAEIAKTADVEFQVSANDPSWRQVCFTAFVGAAP